MGCSGSMNFLQIPGNIKQNFAPFVLDRGAGINQAVKSSPNVSGAPQKFSFKEDGNSSIGRLGMFPNTIWQSSDLFLKDLSFQSMGVGLDDLLQQLPCVQIREYLPDTKLDQTINFFSDMFSQIFKGKDFKDATKDLKEDDPDSDSQKSSASLIKRLTKVVNAVLETIESQTFMDILAPNDAPGNPGAQQDKIYSYIVKFPYMLYYTLQSCVTTNIYELPCVPSNNFLHNSDGKPGWEGMSGMSLLPDFVKEIPLIGKMVAGLFGNMRVNFTPWWDASSGGKTPAPEVELKFSLFNDSLDTAIVNFVFVNTILQNNRWIQYHIFQHSSSLYDVIIGGIGAYRACTGDINVQYKGMLREPSSKFFEKLRSRVGPRYNPQSIANSRLIRIPDVYDVTLKFQSLLPQNFNTFLFNYMSDNQISLYSGSSKNTYPAKILKKIMSKNKKTVLAEINTSSASSMATYQPSGLGNFQSAIKKVMDAAVAAWKKG